MNLTQALDYSRFAAHALAADASLAAWLNETVTAPFAWHEARDAIDAAVAADDDGALAARLRHVRRQLFIHTLARDLTGRAPLQEVVTEMTRLAEIALKSAVALHFEALAAIHGKPIGADTGTPQAMIIVAMGKLGGGELNVSSDVDLVFIYPEDGETDGARPLENREFFERLGRRVIAALGEVTEDGYVFRVDLRLRPYGESGPLAMSFPALEQYLITQGRAWERYAWLKARALTGERHDELTALITPFVYRKYLDYDVYEGLRDIHRQIRDQERRGGVAGNIKLGAGGIREIEFIVQALQIVRGGREPELRLRATLAALEALRAREVISHGAAQGLHDAYVFLRRLEHRLQYRDDRQTQELPRERDERAALAAAMGFGDARGFEHGLEHHRRAVSAQFDAVFARTEDDGQSDTRQAAARALWADPDASDANRDWLAASGFRDPGHLLSALRQTRQGMRYAQLPALSQQRFDVLVPRLMLASIDHAVSGGTDAQALFMRLFALLETVSRRSAYLALVIEHPPLLPRLAQLMAASAWAADYVIRHPILLDELLDARTLYSEPDIASWREELARRLEGHEEDAEQLMDALRHFQHAQTLRLLAQDLGGRLTVERLADHLSALADVVLEATLGACWRLQCGEDPGAPRFAIIGYGKLGGKELGYASDLDLVFVYDVDAQDPDADSAPERYARLAQRVNTWLTSTTAAGRLYDTDLRLRPDGVAGHLVSSLTAFRVYQQAHAWTWEHQALSRARFVAGDVALGAAFEEERERVLRLARDRDALARDVVDMRRRVAAGHPNPTPHFDVKHDEGGMVDIEFSVQFLVLLHAREHPRLTGNIGNIALLGLAAELGLVPRELATACADAYRDYRREQHRVRLTGAPQARVDPAPHREQRMQVNTLWLHLFGAPWPRR
jgi:glutamate-ammonia-ligase adenylyltransferase